MTTIRYTQKKWHHLMPFENNGTKMAYNKYSTWNKQIWHPQKMVPYKNGTPCKKWPKVICQELRAEWFLKGNSQICCMIQMHGYGILKSRFFHSRVITRITLLCLIVGIGSISRGLVVLQKTNNVLVRCHLC